MSKPGFPATIEITEVGLRDGVQTEAEFIPTETKIRLLMRSGPRLRRYYLEEQRAAVG